MQDYVIKLDVLGMNDVNIVGGKNASLGEMIGNLKHLGVHVPGGFATTTHAYKHFLQYHNLAERINGLLDSLDFQECFKLECMALKRVRDEMGLRNVEIMVPFCRTLEEAKQVRFR